MFAGMQWILGGFLLMDFKWYQYTLRPFRTSSYFMALMYSFFYWFDVALAIDLIYV